MAHRKSSKTNPIDPVKVCTLALKQVKCAADYHRIGNANSPEIVTAAWEHLTPDEQQHITEIVNSKTQPDPQVIADELAACGSLINLQAIKANYGDVAVKAAWKLLPQPERERIKSLCAEPQPELAPQPKPQTIAEAYPENVAKADEWLASQGLAKEPTPETQPEHLAYPDPKPKKTLIELTADLQQLDDLLYTIDGDNIPVELQQAFDALLAQREATQEALLEKLDSYAALIQSRAYWAATRKAEADRLAKLAESDIRAVDFLKARLKAYLEATSQKGVRTRRFNIFVSANGGKQPLRFDSTPPEQLPERFRRVTVEPDPEAIRTALEQGEELKFAFFAERETHLRIK